MAGAEESPENSCSFVWDETSNLYFHASSGFYHDPAAGWYYSSRDGFYYTFENESYVPMKFDQEEESEAQQLTTSFSSEPIQDKPCVSKDSEYVACDDMEIQRPSEWLEETLINLYLKGYPNSEDAYDNSLSLQTSEEDQSQIPCEGIEAEIASDELPCSHNRQEEDEWIPEDMKGAEMSTDTFSGRDVLSDEENWLAQYGRVVTAKDEAEPPFPVIDLWDWEMVVETVKKEHQVAKLSGRLVSRSLSNKLHPSVAAGGTLLKTASICEVHLNLVRVASGKVYKLKSPSRKYLASLSAYDSSNPTKDWGFPDLLDNAQKIAPVGFNQTCCSNNSNPVNGEKSHASTHDVAIRFGKPNNLLYRDRAAERRTLHGGFGIGPGQKNTLDNDSYGEESTSEICDGEEAAAEAMNLTFGQGSYARKLLEKMGWKDGEALGCTTKGITEPLQAIGNKGWAGLGWKNIRGGKSPYF